jgi:hypothetical protein
MLFSTATLVAEPTTGGSRYLSTGINEGVSLVDFASGEAKSGTPYLEVTIAKGDDSSMKDKLYFSDKAQASSLLRCIELLTAAGVERAVIDTASSAAASLDDLAARFTKIIPKGNSFRLKLQGEEYGTDGKIAKRIPFQDFAEPTATSPSRLVFDPKRDIKMLPKPDPSMANVAAEPVLPF